ncbi:MAG: hypothetical protein HYZ48_01795 [Chlamydiales bacterium]|nr:hypothetical protein [Chlamydiales bacterium]
MPSTIGPPSSPSPSSPINQPNNTDPSSKAPYGSVQDGSVQSSTQQAPQKTSPMDPTGIWQDFLSTSGSPATPQDVQLFLQSLLKFFSTEIFRQQAEAAKRSKEMLKKAISGE